MLLVVVFSWLLLSKTDVPDGDQLAVMERMGGGRLRESREKDMASKRWRAGWRGDGMG